MFYPLPKYPVIAFATPWQYPTILDSLRSGAVTRADLVIMPMDGAGRRSATATYMPDLSHATWDTVNAQPGQRPRRRLHLH